MQDSKIRALVISDIHLGSPVCNTEKLETVLKMYDFEELIINGDLFDSINLHRLNKYHWHILSKLRKISKHKKITFLIGNHELVGFEQMGALLGFETHKKYEFISNNKKYLFLHGDIFDIWILKLGVLTNILAGAYYWFQRIDPHNQSFARWIKKSAKQWIRAAQKLRDRAISFAHKEGAQVVFIGHTHQAEILEKNGVQYINTGTFTDNPASYGVIDLNGNCHLYKI